ncbi:MAG: hypothetical protein KKA45_11965, partial [Alphaproteobacteria bacterium]|nr:hypothetical protein [Alphaproteobacteria bacterium]
ADQPVDRDGRGQDHPGDGRSGRAGPGLVKLYGYILSIVGTRILAAAAILQVLELLDATPGDR